MAYDLEQLQRDKTYHEQKMEMERQEQDYKLAQTAREVFSWCFCVGIISVMAAVTTITGIWLCHR